MRRVFISLIIVANLLLPAVSRGQETQETQEKSEEVLALSLEDVIIRTLKNNYGVAIQLLNPELADLSVSRAQEIFYPQLGLSYNNRETANASYSFLEATDVLETKYFSYDAAISQLLPTGGTLSATVNNAKNDTNSKYQTINPRYSSTLRFDFRQPLLKGFGSKMTKFNILVSENDYEMSLNELETTVATIIDAVTQAYWNLSYSIANLKVRQQALALAQDLLAKNQRAVEVGTLAPIEILSAQAEVATRQADILSANAEVKNNEDKLRTIINLPEEEMKAALPIKPVDTPKFVERKINVEEALGTAMANRPELKSIRVGLKTRDLDLIYAKNQRLPDLSFNASYWSPGISGDQIIYQNDDPLTGIIIGTVPGGFEQAVNDAFGFKYNNLALALTLDIPLSTIFSNAAVAQAQVSLDQATLRLKNEEQVIFLEIRNGVRTLGTNYERVQAYKVARDLADQKLKAEEEKLRVGLSTNFTVLQYQRDLSDAQISELRAIVDYLNSEVALETSMGVSLKNRGITLEQLTATSPK
jgi:outer membrane protein TolC